MITSLSNLLSPFFNIYNNDHPSMGNGGQTIGAQLHFIQQLEDRHFGEIDIYRSDEGRFIMKVKRTRISGDKRQLEFQRVV
jgi:hypothetical protein